MTLSARSTLGAAALAVGAALHRAGVAAVLTGGACASFYTRGASQSLDIDFVVVGPATQVAVAIALDQRVNLPAIRRWSNQEGFAHRFEEFTAELRRRRARRRRS